MEREVKVLEWRTDKDSPDLWVFQAFIKGFDGGFYNIYTTPKGDTYTVADGLFGQYVFERFKTLLEAKAFSQSHFEKEVSKLMKEEK